MKPLLNLTPVITAIALMSLAVTPSLASKNDGRFQQSIENTNSGGLCTTYVQHYSSNLKAMNSATNKESRNAARDEVNWAIGKGVEAGCAWVDIV